MTIDGFEKITKITNFTYAGYVYNLAVANINDAFNTNLESEDPFLGLTSKEHTIILNGFVSGDVIMQRLIAK